MMRNDGGRWLGLILMVLAPLPGQGQIEVSRRLTVSEGTRILATLPADAERAGSLRARPGTHVWRMREWGVPGGRVETRIVAGATRGGSKFGASRSYNIDGVPVDLAAADFNQDGVPDVAVASASGVTVLWGRPNGHFGPGILVYGQPTSALAAADFDGDGFVDLALGTAHGLAILGGGRDSRFRRPLDVAAMPHPRHLLVADWNGDAIPDIALAGRASVQILSGNGKSFSQLAERDAPGPVASLAAADFDRDGQLDLAAALADEPRALVWLAARNAPQSLDLPAPVTRLGVLDQGEGAHLLAIFVDRPGVHLLANRRDGTFADPELAPGADLDAPGEVNVDLDGDTALDRVSLSKLGGLLIQPRLTGSFALTKTHVDPWFRGMTDAVFTILVTGTGTEPIVADTLPAGVTFVSAQGQGWECNLPAPGTPTNCGYQGPPTSTYPPLLITVSVDSNAPGTMTNTVTEAGGAMATDTVVLDAGAGTAPDLAVTKTHVGDFARGQVGATYTVTVRNQGNAGTSGIVTLVENPPSALTVTGMSGTGWTCDVSQRRCQTTTPLAPNLSYPPITVVVSVSPTAPSNVTNYVEVSGGGDVTPTNNGGPDSTNISQPDLTITKTHTGNFFQGQANAMYQMTVTNVGAGPTDGPTGNSVIVIESPPNDFTLTALAGSGWSCNILSRTCSRLDMLAPGDAFPAITAAFTVSPTAPGSVTNYADVFGDSSSNNNNVAADRTAITPTFADLTITKTHTGSFFRGQSNALFNIQVTNNGIVPTAGNIVVTDTVPAGLQISSVAGTNWGCVGVVCTYSLGLAPGASAPLLTLGFRVAADAAPSLTNTAVVSGGGDNTPGNNTAQDPFEVVSADVTISKTHSGNFGAGQIGATYQIVVRNLSGVLATANAPTVVEVPPTGLTVTALGGSRWVCTLATLSCIYDIPLPPNGVTEPLIVTVNVAAGAPAQLTNVATVSIFGEFNTTNNSASDVTTIRRDLRLTKTHAGNFYRQQVGAAYQLVVSNIADGPSAGIIQVVDLPPVGLSINSMSGTGWTCSAGTRTCETTAAVAPGASLPPIAVLVSVASDAPPSVTNTAVLSGGGDNDSSNNSASDPTTIVPLDYNLTISKTHTGSFTRGQTDATYTLTVSHVGTTAGTGSNIVTVVELPPSGLTITAMSGSGWSCALGALSCTNSSGIAPGSTLPPITVVVTVAANAPATLTNSALVQGNGDMTPTNNSATDQTTILTGPDLAIAKTHSGNFVKGQLGATYSIIVTNVGQADSNGTITVTELLPSGLSLTGMAGAGWTCNSAACTHPGPAVRGTSLSPITVTVNVSTVAPNSVTNRVTVSNASDINLANNEALDLTPLGSAIGADLTIAKSHVGNFFVGQHGATYTTVVSNVGTLASTGVITVTESLPSNLRLRGLAGTGWACSLTTQSCEHPGPVAPGGSLSAITVTVNVDVFDSFSSTPSAQVRGGGDVNLLNNEARDLTTIISGDSDLIITKTHSGSAVEGQEGFRYQLVVSNIGAGPTGGGYTISATEQPPVGMQVTSMSGEGWQCPVSFVVVSIAPTFSCLRSTSQVGSIGPGAAAPPITVTVNVASPAGTLTNVATVGYFFESNTTNNRAEDPTIVDARVGPDVVGDFTVPLGYYAHIRELTVRNVGPLATTGAINVTFSAEAGLLITGLSGIGWNCTLAPANCTRSDSLPPGGINRFPITITYDGPNNAPLNLALRLDSLIAGGGDIYLSNNADSILVSASATSADLTINKSHAGSFTQGQTGAAYTISVSNPGSAATVGAVVVQELPPAAGLAITSMSGSGWSCSLINFSCSRNDPLNPTAQYPPITVLANVSSNAAASLTNTAVVLSTADGDQSNNTSADLTTIVQSALNVTVVPGVAAFNRLTGRFRQEVVITNHGAALTAAALVLDSLAAGVSLYQPSGITSLAPPAGSAYRELGAISAGQVIRVTLEFTRSGLGAITYSPRILGPGAR